MVGLWCYCEGDNVETDGCGDGSRVVTKNWDGESRSDGPLVCHTTSQRTLWRIYILESYGGDVR